MTRPTSGILGREGLPGLPHNAILLVTGWPQTTPRQGMTRIGPLIFYPLPEQWMEQRVTVALHPRTNRSGELLFPLHSAKVRPARDRPNGTAFEVVGRLLNLDPSNQHLRVRIYPPKERLGSFEMIVRATPAALRRVNPEWSAVRVTGGAIGSVLVMDDAEPVYAPVTAAWQAQLRGEKRQALKRRSERIQREVPSSPSESRTLEDEL